MLAMDDGATINDDPWHTLQKLPSAPALKSLCLDGEPPNSLLLCTKFIDFLRPLFKYSSKG